MAPAFSMTEKIRSRGSAKNYHNLAAKTYRNWRTHRVSQVGREQPVEALDLRQTLFLGCGRLLFHLREHVTDSLICSRSTFFTPSFEAFAMFFQVRKHVRIFEQRPPGADHRLQAFPNNPLFAGIFEEHFF